MTNLMRNIKQKFLHIILPAMILTPLLWLMAGCFYIPTFENIHQSGTTGDFRSLTDPKQRGHLVLGKTTRAAVVGLLGAPPFKSADGRAVAYVMESHQDIKFVPLCLGLGPGIHRTYVLKLFYDEKDTVCETHFIKEREDQPLVPALQLTYIMPERPSHFSSLLYRIIARLNNASDVGQRLERVYDGDLRLWTYPNSDFVKPPEFSKHDLRPQANSQP